MGVQLNPSPSKPVLHEHVLVSGPLLVQLACASHPPFAVEQESMGEHTVPVPVYPVPHLHATEVPEDMHTAVAAQPPLFVAHALIPVQTPPSPV